MCTHIYICIYTYIYQALVSYPRGTLAVQNQARFALPKNMYRRGISTQLYTLAFICIHMHTLQEQISVCVHLSSRWSIRGLPRHLVEYNSRFSKHFFLQLPNANRRNNFSVIFYIINRKYVIENSVFRPVCMRSKRHQYMFNNYLNLKNLLMDEKH